MMLKRAICILAFSVFLFMLLLSCTFVDITGGTGHEGEAIITGHLYDSSGTPMANIRINLLPADLNPALAPLFNNSQFFDITEYDGTFKINKVPEGVYTLFTIINPDDNDVTKMKIVYHPKITVNHNQIQNIGMQTLKNVGGLVISVPDSLVDVSGFFYIPGTYFYTPINTHAVTKLLAPAGTVKIAFYNQTTQQTDTLFCTKEVMEGNTVEYVDSGFIVVPHKPSGSDSIVFNELAKFQSGGSFFYNESLNDTSQVEYRFDWGDGSRSPWSANDYAYHIWSELGTYSIQTQSYCIYKNDTIVSQWSDMHLLTVIDTTDTVNYLPAPPKPLGPTDIKKGFIIKYVIKVANMQVFDSAEFRFNWGDGGMSAWSRKTSAEHQWLKPGKCLIQAQARSIKNLDKISKWSEALTIRVIEDSINDTDIVTIPQFLNGDTIVITNHPGTFYTGGAVCLNGDPIEYRFYWGDKTYSDWIPISKGVYPNNQSRDTNMVLDSHSWEKNGVYPVYSQARSRINHSLLSTWTQPLYVQVIDTIVTPQTWCSDSSSSLEIHQTGLYYTFGAQSTNGDSLEYQFNWGDSTESGWIKPDTFIVVGTGLYHAASFMHSWKTAGSYAPRARARSCLDPELISAWSVPFSIHVFDTVIDTTINTPPQPFGPDSIMVDTLVVYATKSVNRKSMVSAEYRFDWGNGTYSNWSKDTTAGYAWSKKGIYFIRAQARKIKNPAIISAWSDPLEIEVISTAKDSVTQPRKPTGPAIVKVNIDYTYQTGGSVFMTNDSLSTAVAYRFSWGNGSVSPWTNDSSATNIWTNNLKSTLTDSLLIRAQARSILVPTIVSQWSEPLIIVVKDSIIGDSINRPPVLIGEDSLALIDTGHYCTSGSSCSNGDSIEYMISWGDSSYSPWTIFSNDSTYLPKSWTTSGIYTLRSRARSIANPHIVSPWSDPIYVSVGMHVRKNK